MTSSPPPPIARLLINGEWISSSPHTFPVYHPQSKTHATTAICATSLQCQQAVEAAQKAFPLWSTGTTPSERRRLLLKAADILSTPGYQERLKKYTCEETGALDYYGEFNAVGPIGVLREAAGKSSSIRGETVNTDTPTLAFMVQRKAIGVILAISPWNAPGGLTARAVAIPLICGNTVVLKSSETSPYTQMIVVEALVEAGLPAGVINYVNMSREEAPRLTAELIGHPFVRKINFTGSDRVGKIIATEAAKYLKPCVFELGGKAPCVVLNDANVKQAAKAIVQGAMLHNGQICMSTERVIVQRPISSSLFKALQRILTKLTSTPASSQKIGPLFTESHAESVLQLIKEAKEDGGAEILFGDLKREGAIVGPHVVGVGGVGGDGGMKEKLTKMRIWQRESFGPVFVFVEVDTIDEAIELANDSDYTLSASLWTNSIQGVEIAGRIRAGAVYINGSTFQPEPQFGNFGLGGATGYGRFDIEHFTELRAICIRPVEMAYPFVDHLLVDLEDEE